MHYMDDEKVRVVCKLEDNVVVFATEEICATLWFIKGRGLIHVFWSYRILDCILPFLLSLHLLQSVDKISKISG